MIWCTLLAMEGCKQNGLDWVLNPWAGADTHPMFSSS
jgi:hypothetical protein